MEIYSLLHAVLRICAVLTAFAGVAWIGSKAIVVTDPVHIRMVSFLGKRWRILSEGVGVLIPILESSEQFKLEKERTEFDEKFNSMGEEVEEVEENTSKKPAKKSIDAVLKLVGSVQWIAQSDFLGYRRFQQQTKERIDKGLLDSIVSCIAVITGQHTPENLIQNLRALILMLRDVLMTRQPIYDDSSHFLEWSKRAHEVVDEKCDNSDGERRMREETSKEVEDREKLVTDTINAAKGPDGRSIDPGKRIDFYNGLYAYIDAYIQYRHRIEDSRLEEEFGIEIWEVAVGSPQFPEDVQNANAAARRVKREQEAQEFAHKEALRRAREYADSATGVGNISGEAALDRALLIGKGGAPTVEVKVHDIRGLNTSIAEAIKALKGGS